MVRPVALIALLLTLCSLPAFAQVAAAPSLMNFQGRLSKPDGAPVPDGAYSIRFSLHDALSGGTEKWNQTINPVAVRNGTFAVLLSNFPAGTFNSNLWLEIKVGTNAALTPRQQLVTVAYAFKANSVADGSVVTNSLANGSVTGAKIANGTITADKFATNLLNPLAWLLGGNSGTNPANHFLGTRDNQPLLFKANNRTVMRYEDVKNATDTFHTVNIRGGAAINNIEAGVLGATIAGGGQDNNSGLDSPNDIRGDFGFIGGGSGNFIDAFTFATVSGGSGNIAQGNYATVGGGIGNNPAATYGTIGGGNANYLFGVSATIGGGATNSIGGALSAILGGEANSVTGQVSAIGGGYDNSISGSYSAIAGGFQNSAGGTIAAIGGGFSNLANGYAGTVSGGSQNQASGPYSFIGGGSRNIAGADTATISGGDQNTVNGTFTTIGGGRSNYAWSVSDFSVISGGFSNTVYGDFATVPGGYKNYADGLASFAAGYRAYAAHDGSFVWADAHEATFASTAPNQFCIRASGGIVIEAFNHVPIYTGVGTTDAGRYVQLLNSPNAPSASGLKAGGILCSDSYAYANPGKNNMVVKGTLGVGYPDPAPYAFAVNGATYSFGGYASSDARWKQNVAALPNALDAILNLRGVAFDWKLTEGMNFPSGRQIGFIAQEVEKVLPELVSTDNKGYKAVNYANVVPVLVEAVKTLKTQKDKETLALQKENAELKATLADVLKRLETLESRSR